MPNITVSHTVLGHAGVANDAPLALTLELDIDRISVAGLIARTVERQIAALEERTAASSAETRARLDRCYLGDADIDAMALGGRIAMPGDRPAARAVSAIDPALETERALSAFAAGHYRVFVDGCELLALEEEVPLDKATSARFLRVVPLVGG